LFKSKKYVRTIASIPNDLWNEIKNILPDEKSENTIGHPIVPYRKVFDGILCSDDWLPVENVTQSIMLRFCMS
jgi:hypothetical protein